MGDFKVEVSGEALFKVLNALNGPGYLIREIQVISSISDDCPLKSLARSYNEKAQEINEAEKKEPKPKEPS